MRLNCGQSVIEAFKDKFPLDEAVFEEFKNYSAGRAPGGLCGAFYAAERILEKHSPEKIKESRKYLSGHAGSLQCRDIRKLKKLPCVGCVEKTSEILDKL